MIYTIAKSWFPIIELGLDLGFILRLNLGTYLDIQNNATPKKYFDQGLFLRCIKGNLVKVCLPQDRWKNKVCSFGVRSKSRSICLC